MSPWRPSGPCAMVSDGWTIARYPQDGHVRDGQQITYMLVKGNDRVATRRADNNDAARRAAVEELKGLCDGT